MLIIVTDFTSLSARLGEASLAGNNLLMQLQAQGLRETRVFSGAHLARC